RRGPGGGDLMFNRGINRLLDSLPRLGDTSPDQVRRMLTKVWLDMQDARDPAIDGSGPALNRNRADEQAQQRSAGTAHALRRLATAVEVHAILAPEISAETKRACAFVAA